MDKNKEKQLKKIRRKGRIRAKISGTAACPRLSVFRSNTSLSLQLIDDTKGKTIIAAHSREVKAQKGKTKTEVAGELGKLIAKKAKDKKIEKIVFDRGGYKFHGRVKAAAEGAREAGLKF